jgi:four helix bundle protein
VSRDYRKLQVFDLSDVLVVRLYRATSGFPADERFGLRAQIRRAAVSVPANIVEGTARRSLQEYVNFLNIATGSAAESRYLVDLAKRLGFIQEDTAAELGQDYERLIAQLLALIHSLESLGREQDRPTGQTPKS